MRPNVHQASHELMREALSGDLLAAVNSEGGGALGSVQCRASAALYVLLGEHPIDRRGRCRSCRRPGAAVGGHRRFCRVYLAARYYLYQPGEMLLCHLAGELTQEATPPCRAGNPPDPGNTSAATPADPDDTEVLSRVAAEPIGALTECPQTPAVPTPPPSSGGGSRTGRPAQATAGPGNPPPRRPRPRRAPPGTDTAPPGGDRSPVVPGGVTWQA